MPCTDKGLTADAPMTVHEREHWYVADARAHNLNFVDSRQHILR